MKETLVCSSCEKNWKREISRGRKPVVCPKCFKAQTTAKDKAVKAKEKAAPAAVKTKTENLDNRVNDSSVRVQRKRKIVAVEVQQMVASVEQNKDSEPKISLADVYEDYYPHPANYKEFIESTKGGSTWHCPTCKKTLKIEVSLVVPPTHRCPQNSTKVKEYQRVK